VTKNRDILTISVVVRVTASEALLRLYMANARELELEPACLAAGGQIPESDAKADAHKQKEKAHEAANRSRVVLVRLGESILDDC
jgi:hypothetical protein